MPTDYDPEEAAELLPNVLALDRGEIQPISVIEESKSAEQTPEKKEGKGKKSKKTADKDKEKDGDKSPQKKQPDVKLT